MNNNLENYWKLHESAWSSFQRRADHEFKFSVIVWTAYAGFIAILLKSNISIQADSFTNLFIWGFLILHIYYEYGMANSNNTDLSKCYDIEKKILSEMKYSYSHKTNKKISHIKSSCFLSKNWSHIAHVIITALLAASAAIILSINQSPKNNSNQVVISTTKAPIINVNQTQ